MVIGLGAGITLIGLGLLVWCIVKVAGAKRAGLPDDALRARLQSVVALNLIAMGVSGLGLMIVIVGIVLK